MFFERLFLNKYPRLDWIQVEISSYCNAGCIYCPHTAFQKNWQNRFLSLEAFRKLVPAFGMADLVYLQGWGEPFLHPQFFEMIQIAKRAGCRVGTTSNGTLLDKESIEKLVEYDLDIIGFSLAGVDEKNDAIRKGTRIKKVLECMEEIHSAKEKYGADNPEIHIAYMLLRFGLGDLEMLPDFLANTGAAQTVVSSLSYVVSPEMETESNLASSLEEYSELKSRLLEVRREAVKRGADIHFHMVSPLKNNFTCSENIARAVVAAACVGGAEKCLARFDQKSGEVQSADDLGGVFELDSELPDQFVSMEW